MGKQRTAWREGLTRHRLHVAIAILCGVMFAAIWLAAWTADRRLRENSIDDLAARTRTAANAYAASAAAQLRTVDQMLLLAAASHTRDTENFDLGFWLEQLPAIRHLSPQMDLVDITGIVRQSSVGARGFGVNVADRDFFHIHRASDSGDLVIGEPVHDVATGRWSIPLSRRLTSRDGSFGGVLVFSANPEIFIGLLDRLKVGLEGGGALLREGGAPLLRVVGSRRQIEYARAETDRQFFVSADAASIGYFYGAERVRAARAVDGYPLVVAAEGSVAEALAETAAARDVVWIVAAVLSVALAGIFASMVWDLRRLRRLRAELERRNRQLVAANQTAHAAVEAKSRFLATMSHELRTPLNAIIGFADLLKSGLYGPLNTRQDEYTGHIRSSGGHLLALINDVLDMSRLDLGAYVLNPERLDLEEAIANAARTLSVVAAGKGVHVSLAVPPTAPALMADDRAFRQVLLNLLSNAVKFTPKGGSVEVSAALRGDGALAITVSDSGIGIGADDIARLFQPFQQADNTRRQSIEGSGLGLVISRRLMELHGGTLDLDSELGKGTRAIAVFPKSALALRVVTPAPATASRAA